MKVCKRCGESKPLTEFSLQTARGSTYPVARCEPCHRIWNKERYATKYAAKRKARYSTAARRERTITDYGITEAEYGTMLESQGGCCKICRRDETLFIDHCHTEGHVRGLLCTQCNVALGMVRDDPTVLDRMKEYLLNGLQ